MQSFFEVIPKPGKVDEHRSFKSILIDKKNLNGIIAEMNQAKFLAKGRGKLITFRLCFYKCVLTPAALAILAEALSDPSFPVKVLMFYENKFAYDEQGNVLRYNQDAPSVLKQKVSNIATGFFHTIIETNSSIKLLFIKDNAFDFYLATALLELLIQPLWLAGLWSAKIEFSSHHPALVGNPNYHNVSKVLGELSERNRIALERYENATTLMAKQAIIARHTGKYFVPSLLNLCVASIHTFLNSRMLKDKNGVVLNNLIALSKSTAYKDITEKELRLICELDLSLKSQSHKSSR